MDFRATVRAELTRQKMSVYRLAKLVGYKRPDPIYKWLAGKCGIQLARLEKILQVLGL